MDSIRYYSKWTALKEFTIGVGSDCRNPNPRPLTIPKGTVLTWEDDAPNGNVWFLVELNGVKWRGVKQSGSILNIINDGLIEMKENGNGIKAYGEESLKRRLIVTI